MNKLFRNNSRSIYSAIWYLSVLAFLLWYVISRFFPGFMTGDAQYQLNQAQSQWDIGNWTPPYLAFIWKMLITLFGHYSSLMILNCLMLWIGLILSVTSLVKNHLIATIIILFLALSPHYLPYIAQYYRDIPFGASLLLAFGLLLKAKELNKKYLIYFAIYFLFFATSIRYNGFIAVFPVCFSIVYIFKKSSFFKFKTIIRSLALFLIIFLCSGLTNNFISRKSEPQFPVQMILIFDVVGTSIQSKKVFVPECYLLNNPKSLDLEHLRQIHNPYNVTPLLWDEEGLDFLNENSESITSNKKNQSDLIKAWIFAVIQEPWSYLKHRAIFFNHFLNPKIYHARKLNFDYIENLDHKRFLGEINILEHTVLTWYYHDHLMFFKKPILYFVLYIFAIIWLIYRKFKDNPVIIGFTFSGFLYLLSHLFVAAGFTFKYTWWCAISLPIIIIYICAQYIKNPLTSKTNPSEYPG